MSQKQLLSKKKERFCSTIVGKPVLAAFVINGSGGYPHHVAEVWTSRLDMFLVHLKGKWALRVVENGKVLVRPARIWVKKLLTPTEIQQQETWIQKAVNLIAETQSNKGLQNGVVSQEAFKAQRYKELTERCPHGQLKTSFCKDCKYDIEVLGKELAENAIAIGDANGTG